jgi:predicted membrane-bound dolichyl-phosphate-mannose-protein mannosyltransferase
MNSKITLAFIASFIAISMQAQQPATDSYLQKVNKDVPHKFAAIKTGATLEVIREQNNVVKIYMLIDDIEQYDLILVERSDEQQKNFSQCKEIKVIKGKYPNNYIELTDQYPLSPKMTNVYRLKTITSEGIMRMYPPVPIVNASDEKAMK